MEFLILIFFYLALYSISEKINLLIFKKPNNILVNIFIFSNFFLIIYLIFSYLFIINLQNTSAAYLIIISIILYSFIFYQNIFNYFKKLNLKIFLNNRIVLIILILYFMLILFPAYDEDTLRYHLAISKKINNGTFYINTWIDYMIIGGHEFINAFSLRLKFEKISSFSNFIYLIFILLSNIHIKDKYKIGSGFNSIYLIIASPYLTSLLSSQKFFLFPCYIVTYSLAYLYLEKKNINFKILLMLLFLNIFCVIIKFTFLPYLGILGLWSLYIIKSFKGRLIYIMCGIIFLSLCYLPIYIIKYKIYGDPFLVLFSLNPENLNWFYEYRDLLSNIRMDYTDRVDNEVYKNFLIPIKLIMPLTISDISKTLGLGLLFIFSINFKENKNLKYLIFLFIISVISLQTFQSRWFLPLLILVSIFANVSKFPFLLNLLKVSLIPLIAIIAPLSVLTFLISFKVLDKKIILNDLLNSHHKFIYKINTNYKNVNIYSNINDNYNLDNIIPVYYPKFVVKFDKSYYERKKNKTKYVLWRKNGKVPADVFIQDYVKCENFEKIEEFEYNSRRIYFIKGLRIVTLYKLNC